MTFTIDVEDGGWYDRLEFADGNTEGRARVPSSEWRVVWRPGSQSTVSTVIVERSLLVVPVVDGGSMGFVAGLVARFAAPIVGLNTPATMSAAATESAT